MGGAGLVERELLHKRFSACSKPPWPRTTRVVPGRLTVNVPAGDLAARLGILGSAGAASAGLA